MTKRERIVYDPADDPWPLNAALELAANKLNGTERIAIACANRVRALTTGTKNGGPAKDGEFYAWSLDDSVWEVAQLQEVMKNLDLVMKRSEKRLIAIFKHHPLYPWVQNTVGVGDKQGARLVAALSGDPYWNFTEDRPRSVSELIAWAGYYPIGGKAFRYDREKPPSVRWKPEARMRAYLVAEKCMMKKGGVDKNGRPLPLSPYRRIYEETRAKYANAVHTVECKRCSKKGSPAQPGSPLNDGHKMARGLRAMAQQILKDLWAESKRLHEEGDSLKLAA